MEAQNPARFGSVTTNMRVSSEVLPMNELFCNATDIKVIYFIPNIKMNKRIQFLRRYNGEPLLPQTFPDMDPLRLGIYRKQSVTLHQQQ